MGWSFAYSPSYNKAALVADLRSPQRFGPGWELLRSSVVGNHHWYLAKRPDGKITIGLDLMAGGGRNEGWGSKAMGEECGPYYYDCPIGYLSQASDTDNATVIEWRLKVHAHHAKKTGRKAFAGQVVSYGGDTYTLIAPAGPRKGWTVDSSTGCRYRMNFKQLARATWVKTEVA